MDLAEAEREIHALVLVRERATALEDVDDLVPSTRLLGQAIERGERLAILRIDLDGLAVERSRGDLVAQLRLFEARELREEHPLLGVVAREIDAALVVRAQVGVATRLSQQGVERGRGLGVRRRLVEHGAERGCCAIHVAELIGGDGRDAAAEPSALVSRGDVGSDRGETGFVGLHDGSGAARAFGSALERRPRRGAGRIDLERLGRVAERERRVLEPVRRDLSRRREDRELAVLVGGVTEQHVVERRQARPLLVLLVDRQQRARGALVRRQCGEHPLVRAERALRLADLLLVDLGRAEGERGLLLRILGLVGGVAEHLGEAVPVARLAVELLERVPVGGLHVALAQRAERAAVLRIDAEDTLPRLGGLGGRRRPARRRASPAW